MPKLKAQLHVHSHEDPIDNIKLSARQIIELAAKLNYDVLAITCHNVMIFSQELKEFAASKRILLIPGIEKTIEGKHVLILNADINVQKIKNFSDLAAYRKNRPDIFVIAPHPYFPALNCLGRKFDLHHELFDAVEHSWFHSRHINFFNKKAQKAADKYRLPIIATSDNHIAAYFDYTYTFIEAEKNIPSIFTAIRQKKIHPVSHDLHAWKMPYIYVRMTIMEYIKKIFLK